MLTRLRHRAHGQEGFTLIELLVVILIIGILAAVAIPAFLSQKGKGQDANVKSDINSAQTAEESYITNSGVTAYTNASGTTAATNPLAGGGADTVGPAFATAAPGKGIGRDLGSPGDPGYLATRSRQLIRRVSRLRPLARATR